MSVLRTVALVSIFLTSDALPQSREVTIGLTDWSVPRAIGRARGTGPERSLRSGTEVLDRDEVGTDAQGLANFIFLNNSRLEIGPECKVTLDNRFYDQRLDVEVREYSVETRKRCIVKVDNIQAGNPDDRIVLNTPDGSVATEGATATVALGSRNRRPGPGGPIPVQAGIEPAALVVSVTDIRNGGFVLLNGELVIRREGFVMWRGVSGQLYGPQRDTPEFRRTITMSLQTAVVVPGAQKWGGTWDLPDVRLTPNAGPIELLEADSCFEIQCVGPIDSISITID